MGCKEIGDGAQGEQVRLSGWTGEEELVEIVAAATAAAATATCLLANLLPSVRRSLRMTAGPPSPSLIRRYSMPP